MAIDKKLIEQLLVDYKKPEDIIDLTSWFRYRSRIS